MKLFGSKVKNEVREYDRENLEPVVRCSICTGEMVAGFRELRSGTFHEERLVRNDAELKQFMADYGLTDIKKIY